MEKGVPVRFHIKLRSDSVITEIAVSAFCGLIKIYNKISYLLKIDFGWHEYYFPC